MSTIVDQKCMWQKKANAVEEFLKAQPKKILLSFSRLDRGECTQRETSCTDLVYYNTLFTIEWNKEVFHGPRTMLVMCDKSWMIETYGYFSPSDKEKTELAMVMEVLKAKYGADYFFMYESKYDDVIRHKSLKEFYDAMTEENKRRKVRMAARV